VGNSPSQENQLQFRRSISLAQKRVRVSVSFFKIHPSVSLVPNCQNLDFGPTSNFISEPTSLLKIQLSRDQKHTPREVSLLGKRKFLERLCRMKEPQKIADKKKETSHHFLF
jgi:hypothetical protein